MTRPATNDDVALLLVGIAAFFSITLVVIKRVKDEICERLGPKT